MGTMGNSFTPIPQDAPQQGEPASDTSAKYTVLYVEDSRTNLYLVTQILAKFRPDIGVIPAESGEIALELVTASVPSLVLMDINLPGIDGLETMQRLRDLHGLRHTPMIAVSTNAMPQDSERALQAGFLHYLTKPIAMGELLRIVGELLVQESAA
jgi:CheY-like chemotaxis protein